LHQAHSLLSSIQPLFYNRVRRRRDPSSFRLLILVPLEEDVVLYDLGVELSKDGSVVVYETNKVARDLSQISLAKGEAGGDLKKEGKIQL
jgi:hypothetical protein